MILREQQRIFKKPGKMRRPENLGMLQFMINKHKNVLEDVGLIE
jgi:hypothetical protein